MAKKPTKVKGSKAPLEVHEAQNAISEKKDPKTPGRNEVGKLKVKEGDYWVDVRPVYLINEAYWLDQMKQVDPTGEYKVE